jgi:hypothetical protein
MTFQSTQVLKNMKIGIKFLVLNLLVSTLLGGCFILDIISKDLCGNTLGQESISPNKKYIASIVIRNCGATTDYVMFLFLRRFEQPSINIEKAQDFARIATIDGGSIVKELKWINDEKLILKYGSLELREPISKWGEVEVIYQRN